MARAWGNMTLVAALAVGSLTMACGRDSESLDALLVGTWELREGDYRTVITASSGGDFTYRSYDGDTLEDEIRGRASSSGRMLTITISETESEAGDTFTYRASLSGPYALSGNRGCFYGCVAYYRDGDTFSVTLSESEEEEGRSEGERFSYRGSEEETTRIRLVDDGGCTISIHVAYSEEWYEEGDSGRDSDEDDYESVSCSYTQDGDSYSIVATIDEGGDTYDMDLELVPFGDAWIASHDEEDVFEKTSD